MGLSEELISQLAKTISDRGSNNNDYTVYGTISEDGDRYYVKLDGSDVSTPVETTVEVSNGDRVIVDVKNHTATVTGNTSSPSLGIKTKGLLESRIKQTEDRIDLEVLDGENSLSSRLTLLSDKIESEVLDNANEDSLVSKITQTASDIETYVGKDGEFTKFKQTVEGFLFSTTEEDPDTGEKVTKYVGIKDGSIKMTGAITFDDLGDSEDVSTRIKDAKETADSAYKNAGTAIVNAGTAKEAADAAYALASNIKLPDYLQTTYIDSTTVISPSIIGGTIYAAEEDAFTQMTSDGLAMYCGELTNPKILLEYAPGSGKVQLALGAGQFNSSTTKNRYFVSKGDNTAGIYFYDTYNNMAGFTFGANGTITVHGNMSGVSSTVTAVWG